MNVGAQLMVCEAHQSSDSFPMLVMYPSESLADAVSLGPYTMEVAWDAPIAEGLHSVAVISHGTGGTHLGYRLLAQTLACRGYVVLMPEHPGNNRNDNSLADSTQNLINRPQHIRWAVDTMASHEKFAGSVTVEAYAVIGHSMGGYTALALAGGKPSTQAREPVAVEKDDRLQRLVLMAPATPWFQAPDALDNITTPVLMFSGTEDAITPMWHADLVLTRLPESTEVIHRVIDGAGHFSFMSPFPESMQSPEFAPSQDPAGFDRAVFQRELAEEIGQFLDQLTR